VTRHQATLAAEWVERTRLMDASLMLVVLLFVMAFFAVR
jgi:hypothetical protein